MSDYKIGRGKPPREHQFKKGHSGNPRGRPKGTKNLVTDIMEELAQKSDVIIGGHKKRLSNQRIMVKAQAEKAKRGDHRAFEAFLKVILQKMASAIEENVEEVLSEVDETLIDDFVKHWNARKKPRDTGSNAEEDPWTFLK